MTIFSDGSEGVTHCGGQNMIEMKPRKWYPVPPCTTIENQHSRPILMVSASDGAPTDMFPCPEDPLEGTVFRDFFNPCKTSPLALEDLVWPSPHFRCAYTANTIKAGETITTAEDVFIMSTNCRLQPLTTSLGEKPACPEITPDDIEPPVKQEVGFFTQILTPGTYTEADLAGGAGVLSFMVSGEEEDSMGNLSGKTGNPIPLFCGEAKGQSSIIVDPITQEYCPVTNITIEVLEGTFEVIGQCL